MCRSSSGGGSCSEPCVEQSFLLQFVKTFLQFTVSVSRPQLRLQAFNVLSRVFSKLTLDDSGGHQWHTEFWSTALEASSSAFPNACGLLIQVVKNEILPSADHAASGAQVSSLWRSSGNALALIESLLSGQGSSGTSLQTALSACDVFMPALSLCRGLLVSDQKRDAADRWLSSPSTLLRVRNLVAGLRDHAVACASRLEGDASPANMTEAEWSMAKVRGGLQFQLLRDACERVVELMDGSTPLSGVPEERF
jgi:hypothetical protein